MREIKFSHEYEKLFDDYGGITEYAFLLEVFPVNIEDLSNSFIKYDAGYFDENDNYKQYPLPKKGKYIVLLFVSTINRHAFTTIRRYTPRKYEYYKKARGEMFKVVIT